EHDRCGGDPHRPRAHRGASLARGELNEEVREARRGRKLRPRAAGVSEERRAERERRGAEEGGAPAQAELGGGEDEERERERRRERPEGDEGDDPRVVLEGAEHGFGRASLKERVEARRLAREEARERDERRAEQGEAGGGGAAQAVFA